MSTIESCFDAMNFEFDSELAIRVDPHTGEIWIFCDDFVDACKQNSELLGYACKQTFTALKRYFYATGGSAQEVAAEMKKAAYSLRSFNAKIAELLLVCKYVFMNDKDYVLANEIEYLLGRAREIAFEMMNDASRITNAAVLVHSRSDRDVSFFQKFFSSDDCRETYECINAELRKLNAKFNDELNSLVKLSDIIDQPAVAA